MTSLRSADRVNLFQNLKVLVSENSLIFNPVPSLLRHLIVGFVQFLKKGLKGIIEFADKKR